MQHDFILVDRSGSMQGMWDEALNSINGYVKKLVNDKVDTGVTLVAFDDNGGTLCLDILRDRVIPATWHEVTRKDAEPRGMTPLNDAVGRTVALANLGGYDKVAIVIITDGHENASHEYSTEAVKTLLDNCRAKNWQVIFFGANFDNVKQAAVYGSGIGQTVNSTRGNMGVTMSALAGKRAAYGLTGQSVGFSDKEREEAKK